MRDPVKLVIVDSSQKLGIRIHWSPMPRQKVDDEVKALKKTSDALIPRVNALEKSVHAIRKDVSAESPR